jgi:hypothetical protein
MADRYTVEDVPAWMIDRGVGHIVAGPALSGWAQWACGVMTPYGSNDIRRDMPNRICRKCRAVLDKARNDHFKQ